MNDETRMTRKQTQLEGKIDQQVELHLAVLQLSFRLFDVQYFCSPEHNGKAMMDEVDQAIMHMQVAWSLVPAPLRRSTRTPLHRTFKDNVQVMREIRSIRSEFSRIINRLDDLTKDPQFGHLTDINGALQTVRSHVINAIGLA